MEGFKEFQGGNLDDAIGKACVYFDAPRGKLEIDIVRDSKSGIFGIVGAQKAMIKARRAQTQNLRQRDSDAPETPQPPASSSKEERKNGREATHPPKVADKAPEAKPAPPAVLPPEVGDEGDEGESQTLFLDKVPPAPVYGDMPPPVLSHRPARNAGAGHRPASNGKRPRPEPPLRPARQETFSTPDTTEENNEGLPELAFEDMDCERLKTLCLEAVERLVTPVAGTVACELRLADGRVHITVNCGENSGILIGREGQTLAAIQYLVSRIVSRAMNAAVRINLDAGEYRQRQDEKLRELATNLAARVKSTGRPYATRPLSSYHRRIIHLTLQDDEAVQTRSLGDGPLKRVVVQRRR